jgi:predicted acetyltransferase
VGDDGLVSDYHIRMLEPDEFRAASGVFRGALHAMPATDEEWAHVAGSYEPGRTLGACHGDLLVGVTTSFASRLALPGGAVLPMAMVSRVGVRADHTRRGVLTALMRAQLSAVSEPFVTLRPSEGLIYGRFGFGVATRGRTVTVDRSRAVSHPGAPVGGRVRLVDTTEADRLLPVLYDRFGPQRPGWLARTESWWGIMRSHRQRARRPIIFAVHSGPDGDDGYAAYDVSRAESETRPRTVLHVEELFAENPTAWAELWRFLLTVDLVHDLTAHLRPLDEPLEMLFTDPRAIKSSSIDDETWLRVVDVPAALAARSFGQMSMGVSGAESSIVIEVRDALLPANSGRYRIGDGPARPVGEPAELVLDVDVLASLFLGDVAPSTLAAVGRLAAVKADVLSVADRLFAVNGSPWCGTYF